MSRKITLTRGIVLIAVAGLALAACTPPLPPDVLAAKAENQITCQTGDLPVGVPEDFTGAMANVSSNLQGVCAGQTISEAAAGDPATLQITESAPTAAELAAFSRNCPTAPIVVPAFAYSVGLAFNVVGADGLVLPPKVVAGILNGTITSWTDPAIAAANAGIDMSGLADITVLGLKADNGSVLAMTTWLSKEAPDVWTAGPVSVLPTMTSSYDTTADLTADLIANESAVAVVPIFQAVNNGVPVASLPVQDAVIDPADGGLAKVGSGAMAVTVDASGNVVATPAVGGVPVEGNFDLAASKVVLANGQPLLGWPVEGVAHMMVCDDPSNPLALSTAQYLVRLAGQGGLETFGVTPLPEPIRLKTFTPLKVTYNPDASSAPSSAVASATASTPPSPAAS
jgi:ABC-type phosphate transport system substrate-binding protein